MRRFSLALTFALLVVAAPALARDRPGTPTNVTARPLSHNAIALNWRQTTSSEEFVRFELDATVDGAPISPPRVDRLSGTGLAWRRDIGTTIRHLAPWREYCFRIWTRRDDNGVRSAQPSAWACARTHPLAPHAPLDVEAITIAGSPRVTVRWSLADQSGPRPATRFEIERASPPGENRPIFMETAIDGPNGVQTRSTPDRFTASVGPLPAGRVHSFRVCTVNDGGRACSPFVRAREQTLGEISLERRAPSPSPMRDALEGQTRRSTEGVTRP